MTPTGMTFASMTSTTFASMTGTMMIEDRDYKEPTTLDPDSATAATKPPTKAHCNKPVVQPWQTCSKQDIKPYNKYKVLYGERKFAQEFAEQKQTLSFTDDLPTEVRLHIYNFLFETPGDYFELWPPQDRTTGNEKWQNLFREYASNKQALGIMRLSKKIREEVADYFYGRLNMRFSNNYIGFQVMAIFNNTIRPLNCSFIKHITVSMPIGDPDYCTMKWWNRFTRLLECRGMCTPQFERQEPGRPRSRGTTLAENLYDMTVRRGFRQLGDMASLQLLEILVPWDYLPPKWVGGYDYWAIPAPCICKTTRHLSPENMVRHLFEDHSKESEYWTLLANLKQQSSSDDLTIALVYDYNSTKWWPPFKYYMYDNDNYYRNILRRGRWVAAYATVMGYKFGYARLAENGAYEVRYDEDTLMSKSLELLKDEPLEYDPFLEPPELSG